MKHNNAGRATGLALLLTLIVALIVAWLAVTQLGTLRKLQDSVDAQPAADPVRQAQDVVDALNERIEQSIGQEGVTEDGSH